MAYNESEHRDRPPRKMIEGNWSCSSCGNSITSLPFQPRSTENLVCRDCFAKRKGAPRGGGGGGGGERKTFAGSWECASCGKPITELPFEPRATNNLKCRDCFRRV